jgi:pimeloyl-ACP methyl ester carboxylesterase
MASAHRRTAAKAAAAGAAVATAVVASRTPAGRRLLGSPGPADLEPPIPPPLPPARIVDLPGRGEVFVRDSGLPGDDTTVDALPVLLLHGWTATADVNFFAAYEPLARDRRVLAIDHRGHGRGLRSEQRFTLEDCADDAAALLDALEIDRVVALGYSMGGPIAMLLARRHPPRVAGVVVQATALEWSGEWWERARWFGLSMMELSMRLGTGESMVSRILRETTRRRPDLLPLRAWIASEFRRGDPKAITDAGRALSLYDARPWGSSLGVPAASVVTTHDRMVPVHKQHALAAAIGAQVFDLAADHDAPFLQDAAYGAVTREAVAAVAAAVQSGLDRGRGGLRRVAGNTG